MKKILSSLIFLILWTSIGFSQEFMTSDAIAPREAHTQFIETYRSKISAKAAQKNIPFAVVAAIMSSQAGANTKALGYNFSKIATTSTFARVGKFKYADEQNGLMLFERPRHNAEATVLVLTGWLKNYSGNFPQSGVDWLNTLTEPSTGLLPTERLAELAVAYEAATGTFIDLNQLHLPPEFVEQEVTNNDLAQQASQNQALLEANQALAMTQSELAEKEQKLLAAEQAKEAIHEQLVQTREELIVAEVETDSARKKVVKLRNDFQAHKANPNPLFRSMLDIKGGLAFFKAQNVGELSNGINVEAQYSLINQSGVGLEVGVNAIQLSDTEDFRPFISPYVGFSIGRYDNTLGFSFSPRAYYFMNPTLELATTVEDVAMSGRVKPTFMFGAGANVKLKLGDIAAFTLYANYMRGPYKIEEKGMIDETPYLNTTKTNLNVFGSGIGLSFKL